MASAWDDSDHGGDSSGVDLTAVADISCGSCACVARRTDGTASAWGYSEWGGDASGVGLTYIADISCGGHVCVARMAIVN